MLLSTSVYQTSSFKHKQNLNRGKKKKSLLGPTSPPGGYPHMACIGICHEIGYDFWGSQSLKRGPFFPFLAMCLIGYLNCISQNMQCVNAQLNEKKWFFNLKYLLKISGVIFIKIFVTPCHCFNPLNRCHFSNLGLKKGISFVFISWARWNSPRNGLDKIFDYQFEQGQDPRDILENKHVGEVCFGIFEH